MTMAFPLKEMKIQQLFWAFFTHSCHCTLITENICDLILAPLITAFRAEIPLLDWIIPR